MVVFSNLRVRIQAFEEEDAYDFRVSVEHSSDPMALTNGSRTETVIRRWSFPDKDTATSQAIDLLRHASVTDVMLSGPLPTQILQVRVILSIKKKVNVVVCPWECPSGLCIECKL